MSLTVLFIAAARETLAEGLRKIEHCVAQLTHRRTSLTVTSCSTKSSYPVASLDKKHLGNEQHRQHDVPPLPPATSANR